MRNPMLSNFSNISNSSNKSSDHQLSGLQSSRDRARNHPDRHANYYEAIIQLRPSKAESTDELLRYVQNQVSKRNDVFISKIERQKTGVDIFLSSHRFAVAVGRKLQRNFKGKVTISRSLHTVDRETSKKIYRVTVLFRSHKEVSQEREE